MTAVALQPASNAASIKHYVDTIETPVQIAEIKRFLPEHDVRRLETLYPSAAIPIWGVTPGKRGQNASKWKRLESGDVTLFSRHNRIFASGVLTHKVHSEALAEHLWKRHEKGETWEYIYFLDEIVDHDISVEELNRVVGYQPNNFIRGFSVLDEEKSASILEYFDLQSPIYFPDISEEEYFTALDGEASLDESFTTTRRKEQGFLRTMLFGNEKIGECRICGRTFPVEFLIAAHIKKRAECSLDERKDYENIVAPMCKFGCDDLFEKRYIYVDDGTIRLNKAKRSTGDLNALTTPLDGAKCSAWRSGNRTYFDWHRRRASKD